MKMNSVENDLVLYGSLESDFGDIYIQKLVGILDQKVLDVCREMGVRYGPNSSKVKLLLGESLVRGGGEIEEGGEFEEMVLAKIQDGLFKRRKIINSGREGIRGKKNDFRIFEDLGIFPSTVREVETELSDALVTWPSKTEKLLVEIEERMGVLEKVAKLMFPDGFVGVDGRVRELLPYQKAIFVRGLILKTTLEIGKVETEVNPLFFDERSLKLLFDSHTKIGITRIGKFNNLAAELISKRLLIENAGMFKDLGRQGWEKIATCQKFSSGFENDPVKWQKIKSVLTGWLPIDPVMIGERFGIGTERSMIWRHPEMVGGVRIASETDLMSALWVARQDLIGKNRGESEILHALSAWKKYKSEGRTLPKRIADLERRLSMINEEIGDREDPNDFKFFTIKVEKAKAYAAERVLRYYEKVLLSEKKLREMLKIGREGDPRSLLAYTRDNLESEYSQLYQQVVGDGVRDDVVKRTEVLEQMKMLRQKIRETKELIEDCASLRVIGSKGYMVSLSLLEGAILPEQFRYPEVLRKNEDYLKEALGLVNAYRLTRGSFYFDICPKIKYKSLVHKLKKEPKFKEPLEKFGRITKTGRLEHFLERLGDNMNNPFVPWDMCVGQKLSVLMDLLKRRTNVACAILYYPSQALELTRAKEQVIAARSKRDLIELYEKKEAMRFDLGYEKKRFSLLDENFISEMSKLGFTMGS